MAEERQTTALCAQPDTACLHRVKALPSKVPAKPGWLEAGSCYDVELNGDIVPYGTASWRQNG